jgi:dTDP-4-amino-4,6-dideoxygalactose transaminase
MVHYPVPIHLQPAYKDRIPVRGTMDVTERAAREVLSLPLYPELRPADAETAAAALNQLLGAINSQ